MKFIYFLLLTFVIISGCGEKKSSNLNKRKSYKLDLGPTNNAYDVIKTYYKSINQKKFEEAYKQWEENGKASNQSFDDFKKSFSETTSATLRIDSGRVEGAAGLLYINIPVKLKTTHIDGASNYYKGNYTLRRSMVDGASPLQKEWHIYSAKLNKIQRRQL